jgi:uncharacterized protein
MIFEWDEDKHQRNISLRGYGFDRAALIFDSEVVQWLDGRFDCGEVRVVAVGRHAGAYYTVVYTDVGEVRRIIASWPSNRKERRLWLELARPSNR